MYSLAQTNQYYTASAIFRALLLNISPLKSSNKTGSLICYGPLFIYTITHMNLLFISVTVCVWFVEVDCSVVFVTYFVTLV